ncbi:BLUF domain-containing protein [Sphingobium algorifonticola]|uniref:BLUF domain-containing protein n=1 Tax=Sphingobium algorifonticola TaxID=2008318 RepID=A0A437J580_9SPHN|nr:BLUF domain-containing protein [Sphingobium algorifonticola]RVT39804.1 BLUF domain-containing protein [Sphingobium algorifonticola]
MFQLIYISTAQNILPNDLDSILSISRRNNGRDGITGMLLFNGKRFLQALEGEEAPVMAAYKRIKCDHRHRASAILSSKAVDDRQFGNWAMASQRATRDTNDRSLIEAVDALVADVSDPNIRALFSSYVRMAVAA